MNILSAQGLNKAFGLKQLFENVTFGVEERERIGVIGANGSGKSTLLRILAGQEPPDAGTLAMRQELRIEYLPQNPLFNENHTVLQHIFASSNAVATLVRDYESVSRQLAANPGEEAVARRFSALSHQMDAAGAWEYESRAKAILGKLGIEDFDAPVRELSGGQRKRVALAHGLLAESDLLLLDEPTNHLDADTVAWLEGYLQRYPGAVILVTHDRYFLDRVARRILEIDRGELSFFEGNFSYYLEKKAEIEAAFASAENRRRAILENELKWFRRGARARRTKEKARIQHIEALQSQDFTRARDQIKFEAATRRLGKKIVELDGVGITLGGRRLIDQFTYRFTRGERLGIIGPNGCGKTTLANLIAGRLAPDSGSIEIGETVAIGYYDQESEGLDPRERAIDYVKREGGENLRTADGSVLSAAIVMERFLFTPQMLYAPIEKLSGGERRRLYLVRTLMRDPNFLILDEPANDLDLMTLAALEEFLDSYSGCLLMISHDRYVLDRTIDRVIAFEEGRRLRLYPGDYTMYAEIRAEELKAKTNLRNPQSAVGNSAIPNPQSAIPQGAARKLSYKERKELAALEEEIPRLETRLEALQQEMVGASTDHLRLRALSEEDAALRRKLEEDTARWEELVTRAEDKK